MFILFIALLFLGSVFFVLSAPIGLMTLITAFLTRDKKMGIQGLLVTLLAAFCALILLLAFKLPSWYHFFDD